MYYEQLAVNKRRRQDHVTHVIDGGVNRKNHREKKKIKSPILKYNKWEVPSTNHRDSPIASRSHTPDRSPVQWRSIENDLREVKRTLRGFITKLYERDSQNRVNLEWRVVALVFDRMFFYIYLTTILVSLATIFPWHQALARYDEGSL